MAWNDGITSELSEFIESLGDLGDVAKATAKSVIDTEVEKFGKNVVSAIHTKSGTGGLKASFNVSKVTGAGSSFYGYDAVFEGNAPNGEPYQKIANVINYGKENQAGTQFVSKAIRKLKGMDERIEARIEAEISKRT